MKNLSNVREDFLKKWCCNYLLRFETRNRDRASMLQPILFNIYFLLPQKYSIIQSPIQILKKKKRKRKNQKTFLSTLLPLKTKTKLRMDKEANRGNLLEDREEREKQLETAVGNKRPITISLSLLDPWDNSCWRDNCVGERSLAWVQGAGRCTHGPAAQRNGVAGGRGSVSGRRLCSFTITVERGIWLPSPGNRLFLRIPSGKPNNRGRSFHRVPVSRSYPTVYRD